VLQNAEMVTAVTQDQIRLHGCFAASSFPAQSSIDAVLLTHAIGGNFYNSRFLNQIALSILETGIHVLIANNRGHDVVNYVSAAGMRRTVGAAHEIVAECTLDIQAWADLLHKRGMERILIAGHSLGAIKSIYSQSYHPAKNVVGIGTFSASRLSYHDFFDSKNKSRFLKILDRAKSLVEQGKGSELMDVSFPFPILISANTYVDKYGEEDRYNWLRFIHKIELPTWLAFGERELEDNDAFRGIIDQIEQLGLDSDLFATQIIPGANHYYTGQMVIAANTFCEWIKKRFPRAM